MNAQQMAYEQGKMDKWERITRTMDEVRAAHEDGKYVVMFESLSYCPYTDAPMGTMPHILKACKTRAEADALINEYFEENTDSDVWDVYLYPKFKAPKQATTDDFEDIPY
jgi:hypothetical protein